MGERTKIHVRKLDLNNDADVQMLVSELYMIDPSMMLVQALKLCLVTSHMRNALEGKKEPGANEAVPIPELFIQSIRDFRKKILEDTLPKIENLIQMMEEGI